MPQMNDAIAQATPLSRASRVSWRRLVALVVFVLFWFELINQLRPEWWLNPQYNYGLIVPVLALYLFWKRWRNRPSPEPPAWTALAIVVIIFAAALFLPIRFIAEANPDWRLFRCLL